jgi:hypothetical protein
MALDAVIDAFTKWLYRTRDQKRPHSRRRWLNIIKTQFSDIPLDITIHELRQLGNVHAQFVPPQCQPAHNLRLSLNGGWKNGWCDLRRPELAPYYRVRIYHDPYMLLDVFRQKGLLSGWGERIWVT